MQEPVPGKGSSTALIDLNGGLTVPSFPNDSVSKGLFQIRDLIQKLTRLAFAEDGVYAGPLQAILQDMKIDMREQYDARNRMVQHLLDIEMPLRLQVAEILLTEDFLHPRTSTDGSQRDPFGFLFHPTLPLSHPLCTFSADLDHLFHCFTKPMLIGQPNA